MTSVRMSWTIPMTRTRALLPVISPLVKSSRTTTTRLISSQPRNSTNTDSRRSVLDPVRMLPGRVLRRKLTYQVKGKAELLQDADFHDLSEAFSRIKLANGTTLIDKESRSLLEFARTVRNSTAHPGGKQQRRTARQSPRSWRTPPNMCGRHATVRDSRRPCPRSTQLIIAARDETPCCQLAVRKRTLRTAARFQARAYGSRELRVACRVLTKSSWRSPIAAASPFANSAVILSRNAKRSSRAFRLLASGVWFASSRTRLKKRLVVSAQRPKFFWFA